MHKSLQCWIHVGGKGGEIVKEDNWRRSNILPNPKVHIEVLIEVPAEREKFLSSD